VAAAVGRGGPCPTRRIAESNRQDRLSQRAGRSPSRARRRRPPPGHPLGLAPAGAARDPGLPRDQLGGSRAAAIRAGSTAQVGEARARSANGPGWPRLSADAELRALTGSHVFSPALPSVTRAPQLTCPQSPPAPVCGASQAHRSADHRLAVRFVWRLPPRWPSLHRTSPARGGSARGALLRPHRGRSRQCIVLRVSRSPPEQRRRGHSRQGGSSQNVPMRASSVEATWTTSLTPHFTRQVIQHT